MAYLGIDIGSLTCDAVLIDEQDRLLGSVVVPTGARNLEAIERATREVLAAAGIGTGDVLATVSTGYGRERVPKRSAAVTEITCHARGILHLHPATSVLIDMGGQDSKAIRIDRNGRVADFAMNDKCAAGTGRFLEVMARVLQVELDEFSGLDLGASGSQVISSMCTVFAESEVVSLVAEGVEVNEIVSGLNRAIASRVIALAKRFITGAPNEGDIAMSGGVARNGGVVRALEGLLGRSLYVPPEPDIVGALGAALIAKDKARNAA